nr:RNA-directed DNA polymerase, eukaryota, reverse transcriptase zinc-binding domain protein [Tanacetum cinerariifolium]
VLLPHLCLYRCDPLHFTCQRLGNWKTKMISYGGRLTLIKSVLGSLVIYFFSLFRAPVSVLKSLESVRQRFFWGNDEVNGGGALESKKIDFGLKDEEGVHRMLRGSKWGDIVKTGRDIQNLGFNFCGSFEKKLEDSWRKIHDNNGAFTVKKLREMVDDKILNRTSSAQETKWCKIIPRKACIFIWRLQQRRLPVYTWLDRLGIDLNSTLCPHCGNDIETVDHCFLGCSRVIDSWGKLFKWWNMGSFNIGALQDIVEHKGLPNFHKK